MSCFKSKKLPPTDGNLVSSTQIYVNYDQRRQNLNDRRSSRNGFYMVFLTSLLSANLFLQSTDSVDSGLYYILVNLLGAAFCCLWYTNLVVIQSRIIVMHSVLKILEKDLPVKPYTSEFDALKGRGFKSPVGIIRTEKLAPVFLGFAFLTVSVLGGT